MEQSACLLLQCLNSEVLFLQVCAISKLFPHQGSGICQPEVSSWGVSAICLTHFSSGLNAFFFYFPLSSLYFHPDTHPQLPT